MSQLATRYFIDLTQPEIAAQFRRNPLVILPAGSVEQHGPHLPAGTDIYASNVIGHAVAERMDGLVLPGGPLGVTPMHMPFEATITLMLSRRIPVSPITPSVMRIGIVLANITTEPNPIERIWKQNTTKIDTNALPNPRTKLSRMYSSRFAYTTVSPVTEARSPGGSSAAR